MRYSCFVYFLCHRCENVYFYYFTSGPNTEMAEDGKSGWIQINQTVVPFVTRANYTLLPIAVIKHAAHILLSTNPPTTKIKSCELEQIKQCCIDVGIYCALNTNSRLITIDCLMESESMNINCVKILPTDKNPFQAAFYNVARTVRRSSCIPESVMELSSHGIDSRQFSASQVSEEHSLVTMSLVNAAIQTAKSRCNIPAAAPTSRQTSGFYGEDALFTQTVRPDDEDASLSQGTETEDEDAPSSQPRGTDDADAPSSQATSPDRKDAPSSQATETEGEDALSSQSTSPDKKDAPSSQATETENEDALSSQTISPDRKDALSSQTRGTDDGDALSSQATDHDDKDTTSSQSTSPGSEDVRCSQTTGTDDKDASSKQTTDSSVQSASFKPMTTPVRKTKVRDVFMHSVPKCVGLYII